MLNGFGGLRSVSTRMPEGLVGWVGVILVLPTVEGEHPARWHLKRRGWSLSFGWSRSCMCDNLHVMTQI